MVRLDALPGRKGSFGGGDGGEDNDDGMAGDTEVMVEIVCRDPRRPQLRLRAQRPTSERGWYARPGSGRYKATTVGRRTLILTLNP